MRFNTRSGVLLLVSASGWYWWLWPQTQLQFIHTAVDDVPLDAYRRLHSIPVYGETADEELARF